MMLLSNGSPHSSDGKKGQFSFQSGNESAILVSASSHTTVQQVEVLRHHLSIKKRNGPEIYVLSLLQGGLYELVVSLELVKRKGEHRGRVIYCNASKNTLKSLLKRRFPLTSIKAVMLYGYTSKEGKTSDCVVHKWSLRRKHAI